MSADGTPKKRKKARAKPPRSKLGVAMEHASRLVTEWSGSSWAFAMAALIIVAWLLTGPIFKYSDTWQLVINTGTTIVTFLMVFLIQRSQNKESLAVQLKLNEIVAAVNGASNRLIDVENLDEDDLKQLHAFYKSLARMAKSDMHMGQSHSLDEAAAKHHRKRKLRAVAVAELASEGWDPPSSRKRSSDAAGEPVSSRAAQGQNAPGELDDLD